MSESARRGAYGERSGWNERSRVPSAPAGAGALAGAAAFLLAAAAMRVAYRIDDPLHLVTWHALPITLGAGLSARVGVVWLGRWWLRPPGA